MRSQLFVGAIGVFVVSFVVYFRTLEPSLPTGDSGELISAAYVLGTAHPPGYPLWTMLAHLFTLLPFGSVAWRVNLMSALLDAIAVAVVFVLAARLIRRCTTDDNAGWIAVIGAGLGSLLLAFSTVFWAYSIVAEVFALNNLFAAVLLLLMLEWDARPGQTRLLWTAALVTGLALTNQQTIVLLAPGLAILLVAGARRLRSANPATSPLGIRIRDVPISVGLLLVGLLPYLYLPLAASGSPAVTWEKPDTIDRFLSVVLRSAYGTFRLAAQDQSGSILDHLDNFGRHLLDGYTPVGVALALVGAAWLWRRDRWASAALVVAFVAAGPAFLAYANPYIDAPLTLGIIERFYILPGIPFAVLAGSGAAALTEFAARRVSPQRRTRLVQLTAGATIALVLPAASFVNHYASVDRSGDNVAIDFAHDLLGTLPSNALLIERGDQNYTAITYAQVVEGFRPDVVSLEVELLKTETYVLDIRRRHPDIEIPWRVYDDGQRASLADLVKANIGTRPVFWTGAMKEAHWHDGFDERYLGLTHELVAKGTVTDPYAAIRTDYQPLAAMHFPPTEYPTTTWENLIGLEYGQASFDIGYALQGEGPPEWDKVAERMYRISLALDPDRLDVYKDLGLLLLSRGGDPHEVISLWQHYVDAKPTDPQLPAIEAQLADLKKTVQ